MTPSLQGPRAQIAHFALATALMLLSAPLSAQSGPAGGMPPGGMPPGGMPPGRPPRPPKPLAVKALLEVVDDQHRTADVDRDGFLTLAEVRGQIGAAAALAVRRRFDAVDRDGSGSIDLAEFTGWQSAMGGRALSDRAATGMREEMVPETLPFDPGSGENAIILRMLIEPVGATTIANADANYDGRVDRAELQAYQRRKFDRFDANRDGALDFTELPRPAPGDLPGEPMPGRRPEGMPPTEAPEQ
jgi:Ca2+-binding EF-hand superfamily protein